MAANVTMAVKSITSVDDSTEVGADEPYVLVTAVHLADPLPQIEVTRYGPWTDVDKGETHGTLVIAPGTPKPMADVLSTLNVVRRPFWSVDNKTPAPIVLSTDFFIVSVRENDDGDPEASRAIVKSAAVASLAASIGLITPDRIPKVIADVKAALGIPTGAPNFDDTVGSRQLVLTPADLEPPASKSRVKVLRFTGGKEGTFDVAVEMVFS